MERGEEKRRRRSEKVEKLLFCTLQPLIILEFCAQVDRSGSIGSFQCPQWLGPDGTKKGLVSFSQFTVRRLLPKPAVLSGHLAISSGIRTPGSPIDCAPMLHLVV
ncbi:hypothetical protein DL89DRAFT_27580 [Linderina pennispora]|uniref:Uncharacterized protein n=1 Tax=Linderina pennispora TaxID=61395 RepID=A0A1Y1W4B4_9FUNG|nr:uncharacterized protein DL89DRAFT_27580 [Linderina pennispora]ORX68165.1 hypothetical protein DL89DRAFT_27580 [Linderina pennispora]